MLVSNHPPGQPQLFNPFSPPQCPWWSSSGAPARPHPRQEMLLASPEQCEPFASFLLPRKGRHEGPGAKAGRSQAGTQSPSGHNCGPDQGLCPQLQPGIAAVFALNHGILEMPIRSSSDSKPRVQRTIWRLGFRGNSGTSLSSPPGIAGVLVPEQGGQVASCYWDGGDCNLLCQMLETHSLLQSLPQTSIWNSNAFFQDREEGGIKNRTKKKKS